MGPRLRVGLRVKPGGRAHGDFAPIPKGGAAPAQLRRGQKMVRTYLVTVRFRRACGAPRERAFVIEFLRPAGEWAAAPGWRAAVALVLTLVRNQRRARQPHPGRPGRKGLAVPAGPTRG